MSSLRELRANKLLRRADLPRIRIDQIHAEPGFNPPELAEDWNARVEALVAHLAAGGSIPPIEVRDRPDGGVWLVEGHARTEATRRAQTRSIIKVDDDGHAYMLAMPFEGQELDRLLRPMTSAEGRSLSPLQQSYLVKRARDEGSTAAEIAHKSGKSVEYISQLLALANAGEAVQQMVSTGQVSPLVAAKVARKHKEGAAAILSEQISTAKIAGKAKVTRVAKAQPAEAPAATPDRLQRVRTLVADDGYALTFQNLAQYRTALLQAIDGAGEGAA